MNDPKGRREFLQLLDVHLKPHAIHRDAALPEIAYHRVDRVRLGVHHLRPGLIIKQQSLRIGFMRPAQAMVNIGAAVSRQADSGLV